jgi:hypothetical protein
MSTAILPGDNDEVIGPIYWATMGMVQLAVVDGVLPLDPVALWQTCGGTAAVSIFDFKLHASHCRKCLVVWGQHNMLRERARRNRGCCADAAEKKKKGAASSAHLYAFH